MMMMMMMMIVVDNYFYDMVMMMIMVNVDLNALVHTKTIGHMASYTTNGPLSLLKNNDKALKRWNGSKNVIDKSPIRINKQCLILSYFDNFCKRQS